VISIASLWLPILLSAVFVFIASALAWTVLPHHKSDYKPMRDEDRVQAALQDQHLTPGQYMFPWAMGSDLKQPEVIAKFQNGPVGMLTVWPNGIPNMGKAMGLSFVYYLVVSVLVAYVASRTIDGGADYLSVFRIVGVVAGLTYAGAYVPDAIWFGRPWPGTLKNILDALVYGLLTAGTFGWLWPSGM